MDPTSYGVIIVTHSLGVTETPTLLPFNQGILKIDQYLVYRVLTVISISFIIIKGISYLCSCVLMRDFLDRMGRSSFVLLNKHTEPP